jgi:hypothetical protein
LETVSFALRTAARPALPREFRPDIMKTVARRAAHEISFGQRVMEWVLKLNPRPLAYATGVVASFILFGFVLTGVRPIPVPRGAQVQSAVFPVVTGSKDEFNSYNDLAADTSRTGNDPYYQLPRVLSDSALVSFSQIAYQKPGRDGMAALVEVSTDGHAEILDVLDDQSDPQMVEQLWWSLSKPSFQPAMLEGQPVPTRIVLLVEKVDVGG